MLYLKKKHLGACQKEICCVWHHCESSFHKESQTCTLKQPKCNTATKIFLHYLVRWKKVILFNTSEVIFSPWKALSKSTRPKSKAIACFCRPGIPWDSCRVTSCFAFKSFYFSFSNKNLGDTGCAGKEWTAPKLHLCFHYSCLVRGIWKTKKNIKKERSL